MWPDASTTGRGGGGERALRRECSEPDLAAIQRRTALTLERILGRILTAPDPRETLARCLALPDVPPDLRAYLESIDSDGLALTALFVQRLRFERLVNGARALRDWYERDAASFVETFREYVAEVAPTASLPAEEALLFQGWWLRKGA